MKRYACCDNHRDIVQHHPATMHRDRITLGRLRFEQLNGIIRITDDIAYPTRFGIDDVRISGDGGNAITIAELRRRMDADW